MNASTPQDESNINTYISLEYRPTDWLGSFVLARLQAPNTSALTNYSYEPVPPLQDAWECTLRWCAQSFDDAAVTQSNFYSGVPTKTWPLVSVNQSTAMGDVSIFH